ncbi:FAD-binding domain-containing protein [Microthyrium microscopicum]|uniref:FAD-binding domain-containing protein n=1 Tax=Microthyrium microscopicum TaxID=703497 RepID=A0A6A6UIK4_9PEZI|nr:FAD-binding domain-containing protein [Microthyrium microscopicum]
MWFLIRVALAVVTSFVSLSYGSQSVLSAGDHHIPQACNAIELAINGDVYHRRTSEYNDQQKDYWLLQQAKDYSPHCRVTPRDAKDVSIALKLFGKHQTPFAVKSGGHSFLSGASNINNGITLDLSRLNSIKLSEDKQSVRLGPGATWKEVYQVLEPLGLTALGARAGSVGVGGFILGGGSTWLSNRHGWAVDSVLEFEVVVYGKIKTASSTENPDLFWALKGGGSNFGIVTAIAMATHPLGDLYVYGQSCPQESVPQGLKALQSFTDAGSNDTGSSAIMGVMFTPGQEELAAAITVVNIDNDLNAEGLKYFTDIPQFHADNFTIKLTELSDQMSQYADREYRKIKFSITVHNNATLLGHLFEELENLVRDHDLDDMLALGTSFQPLTRSHISNRNNALGLSHVTSGLMLVSFEIYWSDAANSTYFEKLSRNLHDKLCARASEKQMLHRFTYLNYAASWQEPFSGYGTESLCKLKDIQKQLQRDEDPMGLFYGLMKVGKMLPHDDEVCG